MSITCPESHEAVPERQHAISMTNLCNPVNESPSRRNRGNPSSSLVDGSARRVTRSAASISPVPNADSGFSGTMARVGPVSYESQVQHRAQKLELQEHAIIHRSISNMRTVHSIPEEPGSPTDSNMSYGDWNQRESVVSGPGTTHSSSSSSFSGQVRQGHHRHNYHTSGRERPEFAEEEDELTSDHDESMSDMQEGQAYEYSGPKRKSSSGSELAEEFDILGRKKPKNPRTPQSWDPKDDAKLKHLKEVQKLGWKEIASHFPGRTSHACQFRWRRLNSGTLKYYGGQRRVPQLPISANGKSGIPTNKHIAPAVTPRSLSPTPSQRTLASSGSRGLSSMNTSPLVYHSSVAYPPSSRSTYLPSPATWPQASAVTYQSPMSLPNSPIGVEKEKRSSYIDRRSIAASSTTQTSATSPISTGPQTPGLEDAGASQSLPSFSSFLGSTRQPMNSSRKIPPQALEASSTVPAGDEWTRDEDSLLTNRKLSFDEVSVLLPARTEGEIWSRMGALRSSKPPIEDYDIRQTRSSDSKRRGSRIDEEQSSYVHMHGAIENEYAVPCNPQAESHTHPRVLRDLTLHDLPPIIDAREIRSHRGDWSGFNVNRYEELGPQGPE